MVDIVFFVIDLCTKPSIFLVDCTAGYCLSGGVCRINGNVPYCQCPSLYTGERCELLIDDSTTTIFPMTTLTPIITTPPIGKIIFHEKTVPEEKFCFFSVHFKSR
jgi:hypothetical protein